MVQFTMEAFGVFALQLYDDAACATLVERLDRTDGWESAKVREWNGTQTYKTTLRPEIREASILSTRDAVNVLRGFDERMEHVVKPFIKEVWGAELTEHAGTQIIRYGPGGHFATHSDAASDLQFRYFSVVCYLNDVYEGGETRFPSLDYVTTPRSGKAIIFPSQYRHCAKPVVKGVKYVLLSWVTGPLPIRWIHV